MGAVNAVVDLTIEGDVAVLTLDSPPVNALSHGLRTGITDGLAQAIGNDAVNVTRPSDIDIIWIHGYGWPSYRGGPMFHADTLGLAQVVAKLKEHAPRLGADFRLSPLLERLAAEGKRFQDLK